MAPRDHRFPGFWAWWYLVQKPTKKEHNCVNLDPFLVGTVSIDAPGSGLLIGAGLVQNGHISTKISANKRFVLKQENPGNLYKGGYGAVGHPGFIIMLDFFRTHKTSDEFPSRESNL